MHIILLTHSFSALTLRITNAKFYVSLDRSILSDEVYLDIPAYYLERTDLPANTKRDGVCIYFRKSVPLRVLEIQFYEMRLADKVCRCIFICGSPNQSPQEYETFADSLELSLDTISKK